MVREIGQNPEFARKTAPLHYTSKTQQGIRPIAALEALRHPKPLEALPTETRGFSAAC